MKKIFYLIIVTSIFYSCGNDLSRNETEKLINSYSKFQETGNNPKINDNAKNNGIIQGFWDRKRNLTSKGYEYFDNVSYRNLSPSTPLKCVVKSIDGIADSRNFSGNANNNYKEAQFTWEFSDVNNVVKRFVLKGGKGVAFFRKFDDGWRIDNISIDYDNLPFNLNESDKKAIQEDIEIENQRILAEQRRLEEVRARRKAEEEKRKKLIEKSKIINKTIGNYKGVNNFTGRDLKKKITLTDVHLYRDLSGDQYLNIWFGSINSKPTAYRFR